MKIQNSKFKIQNYKSKLKTFYFLIVFLTFAFLLLSLGKTQRIFAQSILPLTVAPARQELKIDPGEQTAINVRFYNLGDTPVSGFVRVADFIVDNTEGTPRIIEDATQASPRFTASSWFELPFDKMTIAGNDKVSFQTKINVPEDARPGGRYVAVYFEPNVSIPSGESGTGIASRLASLIYLKINGPVTENALISRFSAPGFYEYGPIKVETEILNRSDYHIRPRGMVTVTNMFGTVVTQEKLKEQNIFPDAARTFTNTLGQKWMWGKYKIDLAAFYGEKNSALSRSISIWVFPWKIALIIILTAIIIILLGENIYKKLIKKEEILEKKLEEEEEEIEKLKQELRKKE